MFETKKIVDVMTPKAIRVRPGHYIDTVDETGGLYYLWVRHDKDFVCVDPSDEGPCKCGVPCKSLKLNAKQRKSVPKLLNLLNLCK